MARELNSKERVSFKKFNEELEKSFKQKVMPREKRYPNGYLGKIAYHAIKGNVDKVIYFTERHTKMYGPMTTEDLKITKRLMKDLSKEYKLIG